MEEKTTNYIVMNCNQYQEKLRKIPPEWIQRTYKYDARHYIVVFNDNYEEDWAKQIADILQYDSNKLTRCNVKETQPLNFILSRIVYCLREVTNLKWEVDAENGTAYYQELVIDINDKVEAWNESVMSPRVLLQRLYKYLSDQEKTL